MSAVYALGALAYGLGSYRLLFGRWPFGLLNRAEGIACWLAEPVPLTPGGSLVGRPYPKPDPEAGKDAPAGSAAHAEYNLNQVRHATTREVARPAADFHKEIYAVAVGIDEHGNPLPPAVVFSDTPEPPVPNLRPAVPEDYAEWLAGYVERGGHVTQEYPYPMHRNGSRFVEFWVTTGDVVLPPLYGAHSVKVIVRPPHQVLTRGLGHSSLFYLDGFHQQGIRSVPAYSDVSASSRRPDA